MIDRYVHVIHIASQHDAYIYIFMERDGEIMPPAVRVLVLGGRGEGGGRGSTVTTCTLVAMSS